MREVPIAYAYAKLFIHYCLCFAPQLHFTFKVLFSLASIITNVHIVFVEFFLTKSIFICNWK